MADKTEFLQAIDDAILDADSLEQFINGSDSETVLTRLSAEYPTLQKAIKELFENGGIAGRFKTLADLQASSLVDGDYALVADDVDDINGIYIKDGGVWVKSSYDPKSQAIEYTNTSVEYILNGGSQIVATKDNFTHKRYYNIDTNEWVVFNNYGTTDIVSIPSSVTSITYELFAGVYVAAVLFYDDNDNLIETVKGTSNVEQGTVSVPSNAKKVQFTNYMGYHATPSVTFNHTALLDNDTLIKSSDLEVTQSLNLAKPSTLIKDKYVNVLGAIANGAGWVYAKIPVTEGSSYTFGNFSISSDSYYSVHDASGSVLLTSAFSNLGLPKTVLIPQGGVTLNIDIARPDNVPADYANLMVNEGDTLLPYVDPIDKLTAIKGYGLASSGSGIIDGSNATFADVIADSITTGALIANLPTSDTGLEVGQAYIDAGTIKVKL